MRRYIYLFIFILGVSLGFNYMLYKKLGLYEKIVEVEKQVESVKNTAERAEMYANFGMRQAHQNAEKLSTLFPGKHVEITIKEEEK